MANLNNLCHRAAWLIARSSISRWSNLCQARNFMKSRPKFSIDLGETHKPTNFQKKILVWAGTYKSVNEVPDRVSTPQLTRAMDKFRIRVNIGMVIGTVFLCAFAMWNGRRLRESGETLERMGARKLEKWESKGVEEKVSKESASSSK